MAISHTSIKNTAAHMALPVLLLLLAFWVYFKNGTLGGVMEDNSVYIYWGQQLLAGTLPYVSVFDHKGPGSGFVTGLFIALGRLLESPDDVRSVMIGFMLCNATAAFAIFAVTRSLTRNLTFAFLAYGLFLMCYPLAFETARDPEPKILVMELQLLIACYAVHSRWVLTGVVCMIAVLIWQPAGLMLIAVLLLMVRYRHPTGDYLKLAKGLCIPFALCVACYAWAGQLSMLFEGLVGFNVFDYEKPTFKPLQNFQKALFAMTTLYHYGNWLAIVSGCGFILFSPFYKRMPFAGVSAPRYLALFRYAVGLWLVFVVYDLGITRRLYLLLPYGYIGCALLLALLTRKLHPRWYGIADKPFFALPVLAMLWGFTLYSQLSVGSDTRLNIQKTMVAEIEANIPKDTGDVLSCRGLPYAVLTGKKELNPYNVLFKYHGIWRFIDRTYPGGRAALAEKIMREKPTLIIIRDPNACNFISDDNRARWNEWLQSYYHTYALDMDAYHSSPFDKKYPFCISCWPSPYKSEPLMYYVRKD